jgi:hypothetical protein
LLNTNANTICAGKLPKLIETFSEITVVVEDLGFTEDRGKLGVIVDTWNRNFAIENAL